MTRRIFNLGTAGALALLPLLVSSAVGYAEVPASVASYVSIGHAAAIHVIGYSSNFPNFSPGAVDNRYPFAKVQQDNSPFSSGDASYNDVGKLGNFEWPGVAPYAHAQFPGSDKASGDSHITLNDAYPAPGPPPPSPIPASGPFPDPKNKPSDLPSIFTSVGPQAWAHAQESKADAYGQYAEVGPTQIPGLPITIRAIYAESHSSLSPDGVLTVVSHSYIPAVIIQQPGAVIEVDNVEVTATVVTANGTATPTSKVSIGRVTVNGSTVDVGNVPMPVPSGVPTTLPSPVPALPGVLPGGVPGSVPGVTIQAAPLVQLYSLAPAGSTNGNHADILATGLHVVISQPAPAEGVPTQAVEVILGEAQADAFLEPQAPFTPSTSGDTSGSGFTGDVLGVTGSSGDFTSVPPVTSGSTSTIPTSTRGTTRPLFLLPAGSRKPLAIGFLAWECLVMAAAAAWVWSRRAPDPV